MTSKIRIRMGEVEIEYEGEEAFLKNGLLELLQSVSELHAGLAPTGEPAPPPASGVEAPIVKAEHQFQGSINTIAATLGVKKGPDLVVATLAMPSLCKARRERPALNSSQK